MTSNNRTKKFSNIFGNGAKTAKRGLDYSSCFFYNYTPVVFFYGNDLTSKKIAAIQLVSKGLATNIESGEVVGLHRNTVSNAVNTNQLLGLNAVIKNESGLKGPIYYTPEKRKHIIDLLESKPGETVENKGLFTNL